MDDSFGAMKEDDNASAPGDAKKGGGGIDEEKS